MFLIFRALFRFKMLKKGLMVAFVVIVGLVYFYGLHNIEIHRQVEKTTEHVEPLEVELQTVKNNQVTITIVVVVCKERVKEALVMIKSALVLTKSPITVYIISETRLFDQFERELKMWQSRISNDFKYKILPVKFPAGQFENDWRELFLPCASQRLFLTSLLNDVDSVLYVDTDTLFLGPLEQIWSYFRLMNSSHIAALAQESEEPSANWYTRFAKHPFYKPFGVNTGVMLMNLTRMRTFEWEKYLLPVYKKYKSKIPWGDQDIINIIFQAHPDKLYIYPCNYNYRSDHCMYSSVCKEAEKEGVVVLHGSRKIFHNNKYPPFSSAYRSMQEYTLGTDPYKNWYLKFEKYLNMEKPSNCGKVKHIFLKNLKQFINETQNSNR